MNVVLIAARYAKALYEFAVNAGEESVVQEELEMIHRQSIAVPELKHALMSPLVETPAKLTIMRTAVGGGVCASLDRFFQLLVDHRREGLLAEVCHAYTVLYEKEKGLIEVRLTTAIPLDKEREAIILHKLEASSGKKIQLTLSVRPEIIGGYILMTDEKRLDASVRSQLAAIQKQLTI